MTESDVSGQLTRTAELWAALTATCFVAGSLGYWALTVLLGTALPFGQPFGALFRMFMYHADSPYQYIAIASGSFGLVGSGWVRLFGDSSGIKRWATLFAALAATVVVASLPGGVLWKIHDMQAGFFPDGARFWSDLAWGAKTGLSTGWLVFLMSFPYNLLAFVLGAICLHQASRCRPRGDACRRATVGVSSER